MKCVECVEYAECSKKHNLTIKRKHCPMARVEYVQTNADRIRAMSDEELFVAIQKTYIGKAPWCGHHCKLDDDCSCSACLKEWLKQPAEEVQP